MGGRDSPSPQSAQPPSLEQLRIGTSFDAFGEAQYTIDLDINPVLGVANCRAVFDRGSRKWKLGTATDLKLPDGQPVQWERSRPPETLTEPEISPDCWVHALPRSAHVDAFLKVDWAATPLGPLNAWPSVLRTCCHFVFADSRAAVIYWGDRLITIPNSMYVEKVVGRLQKTSELMGKPFYNIWPELYADFAPMLAELAVTGSALDQIDVNLFPVSSDGSVEETYWAGSFLPIKGEGGKTLGFYNRALDTTKQVVQERWISTLNAIATPPNDEALSIWEHVFEVFANNDRDFPVAWAYAAREDINTGTCALNLQQSLGIPRSGHALVPQKCELYAGVSGFAPLYRKARSSADIVILRESDGTLKLDLEKFEWRGFGSPCEAMAIVPIISSDRFLGVIVVGLNPRRPLDSEYVAFLHSLSRQVSATIIMSIDREEAHQRAERLREQLADSERKIRDLAEYGPVGMVSVLTNGKITYANAQFYEITGHPPDEHYELSFLDLLDEKDRAKSAGHWKAMLEDHTVMRDDFRLKKTWRPPPSPGVPDPPEEPVWVLASGYPVVENGEVVSVAASVVDISTFKWTEAIEKRSADDAKEAKRLQENFIDIVSHEMRNPLSAITQLADGIIGSLDELIVDNHTIARAIIEANVDSASTILLCAAHQKRIIDDVLTLSKLDSMMLAVTPIAVSPIKVVERVLKMFEAEFKNHSISVDSTVDASYGACGIDWVMIDPSRLTQVFINLVTNAVKFTKLEEKREIKIRTGASFEKVPSLAGVTWFPTKVGKADVTTGHEWGDGQQVYLCFEVVDTGKGLKQEEMNKLFTRFQQATAKTHIKYGGSGLGLFISRELTEIQGGEIGVLSEPGKGSTFAFTIKARKTTAPAHAPALVLPLLQPIARPSSRYPQPLIAPAAPPTPGPRLNILLVEDNIVNAKVLTKQLEKAGCVVTVANHGMECLEKLERSKAWSAAPSAFESVDYDCILMDIEMPVMDGLTATRRIRQMEQEGLLTKHLNIIAITANARDEQIQQTLQAGADSVQPKPFRVKELLQNVNETMTRSTQS